MLGVLLTLCCLLAPGHASGQSAGNPDGFNLPYSQFGVGLSELPYNVPMVSRMGGVTLTRAGHNYINPFNPASYASIEMESFVFDMGAGIQMTKLSDSDKSLRDGDGNISYIMAGFPVARWMKVAVGLMPYSRMNYQSQKSQTGGAYYNMNSVYSGEGGTTMIFLGSAFNLMGKSGEGRRLQAGFNVDYLTGRMNRKLTYRFLGTDSTYFMNKYREKETDISSFLFDLGVQYWEPLGEKYTLGVALTYRPHRESEVDDEGMIYTLSDTIYPAPGTSTSFTSILEQDHTIGVGVSIERNRRWQVAFDASWAGWSGLRYREGSALPVLGDDATRSGLWGRYAIGVEKIGNLDASTYWGRISYSLGAHTERGVLRLNLQGVDHVINEWGIGGGVTLPMRKGQSQLTISVGYSHLGDQDLLLRECISFGLSVSTGDKWFVKRKYN